VGCCRWSWAQRAPVSRPGPFGPAGQSRGGSSATVTDLLGKAPEQLAGLYHR
jgi:hypothetical protein